MSQQKADAIVWDILSSLLQIGGFFLALAGFWISVFDAAGGMTLAVKDAGPTMLISGIVAFIAGARMNTTAARREEQSDLLPSLPERSPTNVVSSARAPKVFSCPSCGYENDEGGFFCIACNSPLWPAGKPTGPPPPRSIVMHKIGRVMMIRKVKRISVLVILALVISGPLTTSLALGYAAVNQSKLAVAFYFYPPPPYPQNNGTLHITWKFYSPGFDFGLSTNSPTYDVRFNNVQRPATGCPDPPPVNVHGLPWRFDPGCEIVVPGVSGTQLNGTAVIFRVTVVAGLLMYQQQITRSVSVLCDSRCTGAPGSSWIY